MNKENYSFVFKYIPEDRPGELPNSFVIVMRWLLGFREIASWCLYMILSLYDRAPTNLGNGCQKYLIPPQV